MVRAYLGSNPDQIVLIYLIIFVGTPGDTLRVGMRMFEDQCAFSLALICVILKTLRSHQQFE